MALNSCTILVLALFGLQQVAPSSPEQTARHSGSSYSTITYSTTVTISDGDTTIRASGSPATYSNRSRVSQVSGTLYDGRNLVDCYPLAERRTSANATFPPQPFVAFLPLSAECGNDHDMVLRLEKWDPLAVVFYTTSSTLVLGSYRQITKPVVVLIRLTPEELLYLSELLPPSNSTVTISTTAYREYPTSQTFYFVVFAFSVLVLLSLTWFTVTYIRRCHDYCTRNRSRRRHRQAATRATVSLPTRKYKVQKKSDNVSVNSSDDPVCAICLEYFKHNEIIKTLPCSHEFHKKCIDPWLKSKGICPLCKSSIVKRQSSFSRRRSNRQLSATNNLPLTQMSATVHPTTNREDITSSGSTEDSATPITTALSNILSSESALITNEEIFNEDTIVVINNSESDSSTDNEIQQETV